MIEDETIGFSMTETETEEFWLKVIEDADNQQKALVKQMMFNDSVKAMAEEKLNLEKQK